MKQKKRPKLDMNRREMPKQTPEIRSNNFNEVALGYSMETAVAEAKRCLQCKKPKCVAGCPVDIDIPGFITAIAIEDFSTAIKILKSKNCLPAICGRVCPQETQCEELCVLQNKNCEIAIGRLERFIADWEAALDSIELPEIKPQTGKRVAVIGSGPAGITVAGDLIKQGHCVTVYEALHEPGGVLVYGIPEFRLPKSVVAREIEYVKSLGVELIPDFIVGRTKSINKLLTAFDAIFIGTGAGLPWFMQIPGENLNGVYSANEYLTRLNLMKGYKFPLSNTPVIRHKRVAVVGGGNVAMDSARSAIRMGADEVYIIYRRSKAELPARAEEVENAEEEGVVFNFLTLPIKYIGDLNNQLTTIECLRMELGEPDDSGRRRPVPIENSNFLLPMDALVCAIGNSPNPLIASTTEGLDISKWGTIVIDEETGKTSLDRIWAGGDIVTGAATVIEAMGAGRIAARDMHRFLSEV